MPERMIVLIRDNSRNESEMAKLILQMMYLRNRCITHYQAGEVQGLGLGTMKYLVFLEKVKEALADQKRVFVCMCLDS